MRSCLRIPRLFLPRSEFESWSAPACDRHAADRSYWERVAKEKGDAPSVLSCIFPDAFIGDDDEARRELIKEECYRALETGAAERLNRGCVLVERETEAGLRRGILASVDLDAFDDEEGALFPSTDTLARIVESRLAARRVSVLEFPHTVALYRDKRDKLMRSFEGEDLEKLYEFDTPSGKLTGYFLPSFIAEDVLQELMGRADPCFVVADGNHSLAAAKRHWQEVSVRISAAERRNHPARFTLVEFCNALGDGIGFCPLHRLVKETDAEAFADFFEKSVKCKREGNVLYPVLNGAPDGYRKIDETIARFLAADGGRVEYRFERPALLKREEGAVVALPAPEAEDLLAAAKSGKRYPAKTFTLGAEDEARLSLEAREISYD